MVQMESNDWMSTTAFDSGSGSLLSNNWDSNMFLWGFNLQWPSTKCLRCLDSWMFQMNFEIDKMPFSTSDQQSYWFQRTCEVHCSFDFAIKRPITTRQTRNLFLISSDSRLSSNNNIIHKTHNPFYDRAVNI